jgi:hypothetical protein
MHDCPRCGELCACDDEDTYHDDVAECTHVCDEEDADDDPDYDPDFYRTPD